MNIINKITDINAVRDYANRIGAEPRGLKTLVVKETVGRYWRDLCVIRLSDTGEIECKDSSYGPSPDEAKAIKDEFKEWRFPAQATLKRLVNEPEKMTTAETKYVFKNESDDIVCVQTRHNEKGKKYYITWTYYEDQKWRMAEPEGSLPLYNLHRVKEAGCIWIHEGAKAAAHCQALADGLTEPARRAREAHPWGEEIARAVHVGYIGGALSPHRTDWGPINKSMADHIFVVADNDSPGLDAASRIPRYLRKRTTLLSFNRNQFPPSFDLADDWPKEMFVDRDGKSIYIGPQLSAFESPATWLTDLIPQPKGRPLTVLRPHVKEEWVYCEEQEFFVNAYNPKYVKAEKNLNNTLAPWSDVDNIARLILEANKEYTNRACYRPDLPSGMTSDGDVRLVNLHVEPKILPNDCSPAPFLDYLSYMIPNDLERKVVERWLATLIAKPGHRMGYGLLLVSEMQGVGKNTLGEHILMPLIGRDNTGIANETNINSQFNAWAAHKRFVFVPEIYSGHSWKAYNSLKSVIADKTISVNKKYQPEYIIDNWAHVIACSNSLKPIKMEKDDRRWFYPTLTERPWPREKFAELFDWIYSEGLGSIKNWASSYGDYVKPGERAPMTHNKDELIEMSRSIAEQEVAAIGEQLASESRPLAVTSSDLREFMKRKMNEKFFETDYDFRKAMTQEGMLKYPKRLKLAKRMEYVMYNPALASQLEVSDDGEFDTPENREIVRRHWSRIGEVIDQPM